VVGDASDDVRVGGDFPEVDRLAPRGRFAWRDERVLQGKVQEVAVQCGRHPGGVSVPEQHVEGRRLLPGQIVVHPVVPDQVVGPQPGEHLGQHGAVQVALAT
jgi:hypothetical protein